MAPAAHANAKRGKPHHASLKAGTRDNVSTVQTVGMPWRHGAFFSESLTGGMTGDDEPGSLAFW